MPWPQAIAPGSLEGEEGGPEGKAVKATFVAVIIQIMNIDLVFSLDSARRGQIQTLATSSFPASLRFPLSAISWW